MMAFKDVQIGTKFKSNGNIWTKKSSRTAILISNGRVFYFKQDEIVYGA